MKEYKVIIFDLDGTLSKSGEGITKSLQYALEKVGIKEDNLESLNHFVGPPLKDELKRTYDMTDELAVRVTELYRERYTPIGIYETELYPGTVELLQNLRKGGKYIAMATSKPQSMAEEVLRHLKIDKYFDMVMGADLTGPKKDKASVLNSLFEKLEIKDKNQYIMIGDTKFDAEGAKTVGIDCIGVSYGYGTREELEEYGAIKVADSTTELQDILL